MVEPRSEKRLLHLALAVIGVAYLLLGLAVAYFAVNLERSPDIGAAYFAVGILALGGTISAAGLLVGSVLGTLVFVRTASTRRVLYVLAILSGWIGTLVLGWLAWQFWTHSFPRRAQPRDASVLTNEPRIVDVLCVSASAVPRGGSEWGDRPSERPSAIHRGIPGASAFGRLRSTRSVTAWRRSPGFARRWRKYSRTDRECSVGTRRGRKLRRWGRMAFSAHCGIAVSEVASWRSAARTSASRTARELYGGHVWPR